MSSKDLCSVIEKKNTNWYIVLSKYKIFYDFDENIFSKLDIFTTKYENNQTNINIRDTKLVDTLQSLSISPIVHNSEKCDPILYKPEVSQGYPEVTREQSEYPISQKLKSNILELNLEYENILNNKPTLKILKSFIQKMNKIHLKNVKVSGTKDILIERIKKEFNLN